MIVSLLEVNINEEEKIVRVFIILIIIIIGSLIWWNTPSSIIDIEPSEVSMIKIFDGNTGNSITVTNTTDIEHIIKNLNMVRLKKEKISIGYMGYSYRTTIYKIDGSVYRELIINSNDTIRKDPFFYRDSSESIDYNFIQDLFDENMEPEEV
ncbi:hypothetical protein RBH29_11190 [Herbivorax sp. ANBcel31]|uniref:hypothetical protein n=1 Tax=Herbivorax sp. ANBcel31 TaxID=3069754 RepID=UPI0027B659C0|nr:hypothetical protein [Herbivorax sp. ANBcel31]MDQ2086991.1 hypothetical protein [Herbivorax sp. ANBcel31]